MPEMIESGAAQPQQQVEIPTGNRFTRRWVKARHQLHRRVEDALEKIGNRLDRIGYVSLSDEYSKYTGGEKYMKRRDLKFFEGLLDRYGFSSEAKQSSETDQEANFFKAVADLKAYGDRLKFMDKDGFGLLCGLFFHQKKIRPLFMQVHARKMGKALPDFITKLSEADNSDITSLDDYFTRTRDLMGDEMTAAALSQFADTDRINLGTLMGYEELGLGAAILENPDTVADQRFAANGVGTFFEILKIVVHDAIRNDRDVHETVKHEFLDRDGVAFQLMRTHIADFFRPDLRAAKTVGDVDLMRALLEKKDFIAGTCPAILKTGSGERSIAYKYAATIVKNIPPRLLVKTPSPSVPSS